MSEFEELANRVVGLPAPFLLRCFVSGLAPDIRREVQAHQPLTLVQVAGLAHLQEEKLQDSRLSSRPRPRPPPPSPTFPLPSPCLPPLPPLLPSPPRPSPVSTVCSLSPEELASRRECGLCFTCDEKFHRGHRCASRVHLLIADEDDPPDPASSNIDPIDPTPAPQEGPDPYPAQISFNSLAGHIAPETLHLVATLSGQAVLLLVDGGSTHNFIQQALVTQLCLPCRTTTPLKVMVGNGQHLECTSCCEAVTIIIQSISFTVDLYVLPITSANVVLGV